MKKLFFRSTELGKKSKGYAADRFALNGEEWVRRIAHPFLESNTPRIAQREFIAEQFLHRF